MKTNKHQTLLLVRTNGHVQAKDLVRQFGYSPGTARSYLSYLKRQDLLARTGQGHVFTERGWARLQYFNVAGCGHPACPLCDKKTQIMNDMFGFESLDRTYFDFYQSKAGRELPIVNNQFPRDPLFQRLTSAFGSHLAPAYDDDSFSGFLSLPIRSTRWTAMNEEIAIYATMFFVSELLRYRTEYLEEILQTNAGWILKSFVEGCPLKFLRIITSRIHGHIIRLSYF